MSTTTAKRLLKEYKYLQLHPNENLIRLEPTDDMLEKWECVFKGPPDTAYEDAIFKLDVSIPERYPLVPPQIRFYNKVLHPNIDINTGEICLDVLKESWSATWGVSGACVAVRSLLESPDPSSPLNVDAAKLLRIGDKLGFDSLVRYFIWKTGSSS